jgi:hypothetical protein
MMPRPSHPFRLRRIATTFGQWILRGIGKREDEEQCNPRNGTRRQKPIHFVYQIVAAGKATMAPFGFVVTRATFARQFRAMSLVGANRR